MDYYTIVLGFTQEEAMEIIKNTGNDPDATAKLDKDMGMDDDPSIDDPPIQTDIEETPKDDTQQIDVPKSAPSNIGNGKDYI